jgi:hypothetical protein
MNPESLHAQLAAIRGYDQYPTSGIKQDLLQSFFPTNMTEMVNDLSNVTSAFYGFLLKHVGETLGPEHINGVSEKLFYSLGQLKTQQALQKHDSLFTDTTAFAIVPISAIYNASPEYIFSVDKLTADHTTLTMTGVDRYYRICHQLGIAEHLTWPTLLPFMEAIKDTLQLDVTISYELQPFTENYETHCVYHFQKHS